MLLGNQSVLHKNPGRALGGPTVSGDRPAWGKSGPARGVFTGPFLATSAVPVGYSPPGSWVIALRSGGLGATGGVAGGGDVGAANLAGGLNAEAPLTGDGGVSAAALALVVSGVAALTGGGSLSAAVVGLVNAAADLAGSGNGAGALSALAHAGAAVVGSGGVSGAAMTALGRVVAGISVQGDLLDTSNIADAILDEPDGVEPGLTLRQALRLIAAANAGRVSGADSSTVTIRAALADHKARITATVDANGNRTAISTDLT